MDRSIYRIPFMLQSISSTKSNVKVLLKNSEPCCVIHVLKQDARGWAPTIDRARRNKGIHAYWSFFDWANLPVSTAVDSKETLKLTGSKVVIYIKLS